MRSIIITLTFSTSLGVLFAQGTSSTPGTSPQPSIAIKRIPPGGTPPKTIPPLLQQYDYGAQIQALEQTTGLPVPSDAVPEILPGTAQGSHRRRSNSKRLSAKNGRASHANRARSRTCQ